MILLLLIFLRRTLAFGIRTNFWVICTVVILAVVAFRSNQNLPLKLYPVIINGCLLTIFGLSLWTPPTIVERIARLGWPDLPPGLVTYTRKVTQAWCIFFSANAAIAFWTAVGQSDAVWFYYNGIIAYCLAGCIFGIEWLCRRRVLRAYGR